MCAALKSCCQQAGIAYDGALCSLSVGAGLVFQRGSIDPIAAEACLAHAKTEATTCMPESWRGGPCLDVYNGSVEAGGSCQAADDCKRPPGGEADCVSGECVAIPRGTMGSPCRLTCSGVADGICFPSGSEGSIKCHVVDGLYCDTATSTCKQRLPVGATGCGTAKTLDACDDDGYCDADSCVARKAAGESCAVSSECVAGTLCDAGNCVAAKAHGQACTAGSVECGEGRCFGGACVSPLSDICG